MMESRSRSNSDSWFSSSSRGVSFPSTLLSPPPPSKSSSYVGVVIGNDSDTDSNVDGCAIILPPNEFPTSSEEEARVRDCVGEQHRLSPFPGEWLTPKSKFSPTLSPTKSTPLSINSTSPSFIVMAAALLLAVLIVLLLLLLLALFFFFFFLFFFFLLAEVDAPTPPWVAPRTFLRSSIKYLWIIYPSNGCSVVTSLFLVGGS